MLNYLSPRGESGSPIKLFKTGVAGELDLRLGNIRTNFEKGFPRVYPGACTRKSNVMKLVCFGPSLENTWTEIEKTEGDIWTLSGANRYLFERGIKADFHLEADPREHKSRLLEGSCPETTYLIASRCSPRMFDVLSGRKIFVFHIAGDKDEKKILDELYHGEFLIPPAWTMGNTALIIGILLGYEKFRIFSMDGSFKDGKQHPVEHPNEWPSSEIFTVDKGLQTERKFISHHSHIIAAECFIKIMEKQPYGTFEFIGDGMIPYMYQCYTKDYR